jgi:hypothetical protein
MVCLYLCDRCRQRRKIHIFYCADCGVELHVP